MTLVDQVDITLSRNQTFLILTEPGRRGPNGEEKFLYNRTQEKSWWIPNTMQIDPTIHRRADGAPYVFDRKPKQSVYCIALQKTLMGLEQGFPVTGAVPLPAETSSGSQGTKAATTHGSVPLPGMQRSSGFLPHSKSVAV